MNGKMFKNSPIIPKSRFFVREKVPTSPKIIPNKCPMRGMMMNKNNKTKIAVPKSPIPKTIPPWLEEKSKLKVLAK